MDELQTTDTWTPDDDAFLRSALLSLRADVEATPLPEPAFVRARGAADHRRRMLAITAAVAAAVVIVGALGFRGLAREDAAPPPLPATPSPSLVSDTPTTTTRPTPTLAPSSSATRAVAPRPSSSPTRRSPTATSDPTPGQPKASAPAGGGSTPPPAGQTPPTIHTVGSPRPASSLFLGAAAWTSAGVAESIVSEWPNEATVGAMMVCDPNAEVAPAGVTWMKDTTTGDFIGGQRVQTSNLSSDGDSNDSEPAAVVRAMLADPQCASNPDPDVTIKAGPRAGTVAVTSDYPNGSGPRTDYVGVVAMRGNTNTATIVITGQREANSASTWAALGRLMDAAAAR
ncbi:hypothetical protein N802_16080 [Knoellia sinensis KCTC 19936]|uniref:Uncharacterized protein n=1 Tax=Knoellia sinensis KCTC 19936 TaxID=1385520 RepID=A0A0A0JAK2_9MICO|nr:hypothetical protein [Knoellia sinensis]KGN33017.1 hypothetical protein N802_16080 [Knoellia sinensis KCTC 19936]